MEKNAFELKAGDKFQYGGRTYRATQNPTGEFATYIKVYDDQTGADSEIYLPSGAVVFIEESGPITDGGHRYV